MAPRRRQRAPEEEGGGDFMTTFADMVTLLMAFFVLLFAMSSVDQAKFIVLLKGLEENFGNSTLQEGVLNGGDSIVGANLAAGSAIPAPGGSLSLIEVEAPPDPTQIVAEDETRPDRPEEAAGGTDGDDDGSPTLTRADLEEVRRALEVVLAETGFDDDVSLRFNERGLAVAIATDDLLFDTGSAELRGEDIAILDVIAAELTGFDNEILVDGHTDDVPFGGGAYSNLDLSADRAVAVAHYLTDFRAPSVDGQPGPAIAPVRLVPTGYGEWRPLGDNATAEGRGENRRVELIVAAEDRYRFGPDDPSSAAPSQPGAAVPKEPGATPTEGTG